MRTSARACAGGSVCAHTRLLSSGILILSLAFLFTSDARADIITQIGGSTKYFAVLYTGKSGGQLQISQGTINGDIGVGGTGNLKATGSGAINGNVYFGPGAALNSGSNKTINGSLYYNDSNVGTDLTDISHFSSTEAAYNGYSLGSITGTTVVNASTGISDGHGNKIFSVTSLSLPSSGILTINGDGAGDNVILNINGNAFIQGNIVLNGISPDQVMFNVTGGSLKIQDGNAYGDFVDVNGSIMVSAEVLNGRVFGGNGDGIKIVSDSTLTAPSAATPEPALLFLSGTVLLGLTPLLKRKLRRNPRRESE